MKEYYESEEREYDDSDSAYDTMRDDFLLINSESDALYCYDMYGENLSFTYMPNRYKYVLNQHCRKLIDVKNRLNKDNIYDKSLLDEVMRHLRERDEEN